MADLETQLAELQAERQLPHQGRQLQRDSRKDQVEVQRTINIRGIKFVQSELDGKKSKYRMGNFRKAWAAWSGIMVKLAPYVLQAELEILLFIYTMTLYDLLEKYT